MLPMSPQKIGDPRLLELSSLRLLRWSSPALRSLAQRIGLNLIEGSGLGGWLNHPEKYVGHTKIMVPFFMVKQYMYIYIYTLVTQPFNGLVVERLTGNSVFLPSVPRSQF